MLIFLILAVADVIVTALRGRHLHDSIAFNWKQLALGCVFVLVLGNGDSFKTKSRTRLRPRSSSIAIFIFFILGILSLGSRGSLTLFPRRLYPSLFRCCAAHDLLGCVKVAPCSFPWLRAIIVAVIVCSFFLFELCEMLFVDQLTGDSKSIELAFRRIFATVLTD